jgi:hypothetical protein
MPLAIVKQSIPCLHPMRFCAAGSRIAFSHPIVHPMASNKNQPLADYDFKIAAQ